MRSRVLLALVSSLVGAALSGVLLLHHHGESLGRSAAEAVCAGDEAQSGCDVVNQSDWAEIGGVPLAALGAVFYLGIALLLLLGVAGGDRLRDGAAGIAFWAFAAALAVDLLLLAVQAFALHAFCKLCLATYALNVAAFIALLPARKNGAEARGLTATSEGRLLAVGTLAGLVAFGTAAAAAEVALKERASQRAASVLGTPLPAPAAEAPAAAATPEPSAAPAPEAKAATPAAAGDPRLAQELKAAQDELKRLKEILDDPQKLDRFFADRNLKQFTEAKPQTFDLKETPFKGPAAAPIKVVEYADFLCPFCRNLSLGLGQYLPSSAERVAVYFRHYPLDAACNPTIPKTIHEGACWLAQGAVCAQEQGKFWPYHDKVYTSELRNVDRATAVKLAGEAGLDTGAFDTCIGSARAKEQVVADIKAGKDAGVSVTPTIFINGRKLPRTNEFLEAVDSESQRLGLGPMPAPRGGRQ